MVGPGATYAQMITGEHIAARDANAAPPATSTPLVDMF
jgi:acetolactate synthase-1/2/3 large subunit